MILNKSISVIGGGKVGTVLARFFKHKDWNINSVVAQTFESAKQLGDDVNAQSYSNFISMRNLESDFILIAIPDDQIHLIDEQISIVLEKSELRPTIFHTSGIKTSDELALSKKIGCTTFSFHPIQTFFDKNMDIHLCENLGVGIEGDDDEVKTGFELADELGWKPIRISKENKPLYHVACVFASNYLTTLASVSSNILKEAAHFEDDVREYILPIMNAALIALHKSPPENVLTGPISRDDFETLKCHFKALQNNQNLFSLYCELGKHTLKLVFKNKKISSEQYNSLKQLFESAKQT